MNTLTRNGHCSYMNVNIDIIQSLNLYEHIDTLIYQCENYLSPPLDTPLYIQQKSGQSVEKLRKFIFFPFGEKHLNGQNVQLR